MSNGSVFDDIGDPQLSQLPKRQRSMSKPVGLDDFAQLSAENGIMVPEFAQPGSPIPGGVDQPRSMSLGNDSMALSSMEALAIKVYDLADHTPPECRRRSAVHKTLSSSDATGFLTPPQDALFGHWQERPPSGDDTRSVKSHSSTPSHKDKETVTVEEAPESMMTKLRRSLSKSLKRNELRPGDLTPRSDGDLTPRRRESRPHSPVDAEMTPVGLQAQDPVANAMSLQLPAEHQDQDLTPVNDTHFLNTPESAEKTAKGLSRFSIKRQLDRRHTEPNPRVSLEVNEESKGWARRGSRRIQRLRQYFETFHLGGSPQGPVFSPEGEVSPIACQDQSDIQPNGKVERAASDSAAFAVSYEEPVFLQESATDAVTATSVDGAETMV